MDNYMNIALVFGAAIIVLLIAVYIVYIIFIKKSKKEEEKEQNIIEPDLNFEEKLKCYREFADAFAILNDDPSVVNCNKFVTVANQAVELCNEASKELLLDLMLILQLTRYRIDGGIIERYDNVMKSLEKELEAASVK